MAWRPQACLDNLKPKAPRYDEHKKRGQLILTPTAWDILNTLAKEAGLSRSEFVEQLARAELNLVDGKVTQKTPS
jgi:hypothetical protein